MFLKVPYYKQSTSYTCGPTCLQMVFKFWGKFKGEAKLAKEVHARPKNGTYRRQMVIAVRKRGFHCHVKDGASFSDIKKNINLGLPVIVYYIEPTDDAEHYAVIIGFKGNKIIMNDPWNGKGFKIDKKNFLSRWRSKNNKIKNWTMVVSKIKFSGN